MSDSSDDEEEDELEEERQQRQPKKRISRSLRAGVIFPVGKIEKSLRKLVKERLTAGAAVYLAGVFQSLTAEIIECAGCIAAIHEDRRIKPRHIMLTIEGDDEFRELLGHVVIPKSGRPVGVLAPLHPPTSRLRLSKERRQKLEEADVRKFKARVRSKNNDECEDDTDEYPPTSDIDEERYFPRDYKMSSPKPWPLPKRFSNIASIGINSGYQIHTKKNQRMPSPPEEDLSPSPSPVSPPLPTSSNHTPPHRSTPDSASRWRRGSSLQRTNKTGRKARERSPSERGDSKAGSSSSDSNDEQNGRRDDKKEKQRRKPNVYEFRPVERKKAPLSHPTTLRTTESDFEIGSHLRSSPVIDEDNDFFNDYDAGGDGNNCDDNDNDDDDDLPDLPFSNQSTGSRQKEVQTKEKKKQISRRRSSSTVSLEKSPPSLPSTDRDSSDLSSFNRKVRDTVDGRGLPFTDRHRRKSNSKGNEEKQRRSGTKITRPSSRWGKDTNDDSDVVSQFKNSVISRNTLLQEVDKDMSDAGDNNTTRQKSRIDSFASDKIPQDSVAIRKMQLSHRTMLDTRRRRSMTPGDSQSHKRDLWYSVEKSRKVKSYTSNIRPARATAKGVLVLCNRLPEAETRSPSSHVSSIIRPSSHTSMRKAPKATNRDLSRLDTPAVPDMDLSQTTQASLCSRSDSNGFERASHTLSAGNQALQRQRSRSALLKSKNLPSNSFRMQDSSSQEEHSDRTELQSDIMELDHPDTDGTDGDDEKESKARSETAELEDVKDDTARQSSPELEEQPLSKRRPPSTTNVVAPAASLPFPTRKSALSTFQLRSQSVRSSTGLENESQVENALYEADSIASAEAREEILQSAEDSNLRSSLLDSSRSGSSNRPAAQPGSARTLNLLSSSLPRLLPSDIDSDIELLSSQSPRTASTPSSNQPRSTARVSSRASVATIPVVDPNIIDISSGEEEDLYLNTKDDVIFVKEERPDNPATDNTGSQTAGSQTSTRERGAQLSASDSANSGDKETQESVEI